MLGKIFLHGQIELSFPYLDEFLVYFSTHNSRSYSSICNFSPLLISTCAKKHLMVFLPMACQKNCLVSGKTARFGSAKIFCLASMANPQKNSKTYPKSYPRYFPTYPRNGKTTVVATRIS